MNVPRLRDERGVWLVMSELFKVVGGNGGEKEDVRNRKRQGSMQYGDEKESG